MNNKNNLFESIENNEIVKNIVDDSKKMLDEFLGLMQGKKLKEGLYNRQDNQSNADTLSTINIIEPKEGLMNKPANNNYGTYVTAYTLREIDQYEDMSGDYNSCLIDMNPPITGGTNTYISNNRIFSLSKEFLEQIMKEKNILLSVSDAFNLLVLLDNKIKGRLEKLLGSTDFENCSKYSELK